MPDQATIRRRGGVLRVRTKRLPDGRYVKVYVMRRPGPHGGRTIVGEIHERKP